MGTSSCESDRCSVGMATAPECVSEGNLFVNSGTAPVFESVGNSAERTPESRLDVLLSRCALVKNELTVLNEERVELETNLRLDSPHARSHALREAHSCCRTQAAQHLFLLRNVAGCRSLVAVEQQALCIFHAKTFQNDDAKLHEFQAELETGKQFQAVLENGESTGKVLQDAAHGAQELAEKLRANEHLVLAEEMGQLALQLDEAAEKKLNVSGGGGIRARCANASAIGVLHCSLCSIKGFITSMDVMTSLLPNTLCEDYRSYQLLGQRVCCCC